MFITRFLEAPGRGSMKEWGGSYLILYFVYASPVTLHSVQHLLQEPGLDINSVTKWGSTALYCATQNENCPPSVFELLIKEGADVHHI